ncbi:MAG: hypothetical protein H8E53_00540 [Planctomycetes bacterium]|nr:hypothetical protein [Planctomycetota bacterium]
MDLRTTGTVNVDPAAPVTVNDTIDMNYAPNPTAALNIEAVDVATVTISGADLNAGHTLAPSAGTLKISAPSGLGWIPGQLNQSTFNDTPNNATWADMTGATYTHVEGRTMTGDKAGTILVTPNVWHTGLATTEIQNWNTFPTFNGNTDTFSTAFSGAFIPSVSGSYGFRMACDDSEQMWMDVGLAGAPGDGVFDAGDMLGAYNNQGTFYRDLIAGTPYSFIAMAREQGGGQSINWYVTKPSGGEDRVNPADVAGNGGVWATWGITTFPDADMSGTHLDIGEAGTTLELTDMNSPVLGNLTFTAADKILTVTGGTSASFGDVVTSGNNTVTVADLEVRGSLAPATGETFTASGNLSVASTGTIGGNGTISADNIIIAGEAEPGASVGTTLITGNVNILAGAGYNWEMDGVGNDLIAITGDLTIASALEIDITLLSGAAPTPAAEYEIMNWTGADPVAQIGDFAAGSSDFDWDGDTDSDWDVAANWDPESSVDFSSATLTYLELDDSPQDGTPGGKLILSGIDLSSEVPMAVSNGTIDLLGANVTGPDAASTTNVVASLTLGGTQNVILSTTAGGSLQVAGATTVNAGSTLNVIDAGMTTGTLTVDGTVNLGAADLDTDVVDINSGGVVDVNDTTTLEIADLHVSSGGTLTFTGGSPIIASATQISGQGDVSVDGAAVSMQTGSTISFATGVLLNSGSLTIVEDANLGSAGQVAFNGGTLISTGRDMGREAVVGAAGGTIDVAAATTLNLNSTAQIDWSAGGVLTKTGDGTLQITRADAAVVNSGGELKAAAGDVSAANGITADGGTVTSNVTGGIHVDTALVANAGGVVSVGATDALGGGGGAGLSPHRGAP